MDCVDVRDRLTEHALGLLPAEESVFVARHLEWCAGCRKEAEELDAAATWVGLSAEQAEPPAGLEGRVVGAVTRAAHARAPWRRRVRLLTVATAAAVLVAIVGVGWGAAMFARVQTSEDRARQAEQASRQTIRNLQTLLNQFLDRQPQAGPHAQVRRSTLAPSAGHEGGAGALVFTSPSQEDWTLVIVGGMADRGLPYRVFLRDQRGREVDVGAVRRLSADGGARVFRSYQRSLNGFSQVVVRDGTGAVVLSGDLGTSEVHVQG